MQTILFFRKKLNTPFQQVVFVAASDDPNWLRENLEDMDDLYLAEDLFEDKKRGGEYDLALLSLCNHSIIGVKTFFKTPHTGDTNSFERCG